MPLTLISHLSHLPDASTGLVYMGDGRWLDAFTGHTQQANVPGFHTSSPRPLGTLKTQSKPYNGLAGWEPYAFGFVKNTVAEVIKYSIFNTMIEYTQRINITIVSDVPFSLGNYRVRNAASSGLIVDGGTTAKIEFSVSAWSKRFGQDIPPLSEKLARQLASQVQEIDLVASGIIVSAGGRYGVNGALVGSPRITGYHYQFWDEIEGLRFGRTAVFGFGLDFAAGAYFQYQIDKGNPFLTQSDRQARLIAVGIGEAAGAFLLTGLICGSTAGIGCLVLAGVGGGVVGNQFVTNFIFPSLITDEPNLRPR